MRRVTTSTIALLLLGSVSPVARELLSSDEPVLLHPPARLDAETRMALGVRIPFEEMERYELELIPGVSEQLSTSLLHWRSEVLRAARAAPCSQAARTFELVPGIGAARARTLERYIALPCLDSARLGHRIRATQR